MDSEAQIASQLRELGEFIFDGRQAVMGAWRQSVRNDPELQTPRNLSRSRFDDHIPAFLAALSKQLAAWPGAGIAQAESEQEERSTEHGAHRWQEGYALSEVAREWLHLQLVLLDMMEQQGAERGYVARTMLLARRTLAIACGSGVSRSVSEYTRLMQGEAAGRVEDLNVALAALNDLQRQRAESWREAAHELRNTVGVVTNATGILKRDDAPEPIRAKSLATLQSGVATLRTMLNDLLDLARLEAGLEERDLALVDVVPLLHRANERMQAAMEEAGIALSREGPSRLEVEADAQKLTRLADKLLETLVSTSAAARVTFGWARMEGADADHWLLSLTVNRPIAAGAASPAPRAARAASQPLGAGIAASLVKHLCELLDATVEEGETGERYVIRVIFPCHYPVR